VLTPTILALMPGKNQLPTAKLEPNWHGTLQISVPGFVFHVIRILLPLFHSLSFLLAFLSQPSLLSLPVKVLLDVCCSVWFFLHVLCSYFLFIQPYLPVFCCFFINVVPILHLLLLSFLLPFCFLLHIVHIKIYDNLILNI
jgi:hypothetical protein